MHRHVPRILATIGLVLFGAFIGAALGIWFILWMIDEILGGGY